MRTLVAVCAIFGLGACYSGVSGPGRIDADLPADALVSALTSAEAAALCAARDNHFNNLVSADDVHHYICVSQAAAAPDCPAAYDACIVMDYTPPPPPATCSFTFDPATCRAPVAQLEDCLTEINVRSADFYTSADCDPPDPPPPPTPLPACEAIAAVCPGVA